MPARTAIISAGLGVGALLALAGCAEMQGTLDDVLNTPGALASTEFECDGGREINVAFSSDGDETQVQSGNDSVNLRLVDRREGGDTRIYENRRGTVRMIDEGDEIHLRVEDKDNFDNCQPEDRRYRRS
jgi:hypothetical protein